MSSDKRTKNRAWNRLLKCLLLFALVMPEAGYGAVSATLAWNPSSDTNVTGFNIYYGTVSHQYTSMVSVGNVSTATINNLQSGTLYYFAATTHDANGNESAFSNETTFGSFKALAGNTFCFNALPDSMTNDQVTFSLASGAPANASINSTNGALSWNTSLADANTSGSVTIIINDLSNPGASTEATIQLAVSDYLAAHSTSVPVQVGQASYLPLTTVTSDDTTNLGFSINWPGNLLLNPVLSFNPLANGADLNGELQNDGTNLFVHIWATSGVIPPGTNQIAEINYLAAPGQTSAFLNLPIANVWGDKTNGSAFWGTVGGKGEVVMVGTNPLLRAHVANQNRSLTIYSIPGNSYQLQFNTNFPSATGWQPVQNYLSSSLEQTVPVDATSPVIFYRLQKL